MSTPILSYPRTAVVGATDLTRMAQFCSAFGMLPRKRRTVLSDIARALYGLDQTTEEIEMYTPGSNRTVRIVQTPHPAVPFAPLTMGPYGVDFFSRDIDLTLDMARAAGGHNFTDLVGYGWDQSVHPGSEDAPKTCNEVLLQGPDEFTVYVTDINKSPDRYHSLLDEDPQLVNSELIMLVWVTDPLISRTRFLVARSRHAGPLRRICRPGKHGAADVPSVSLADAQRLHHRRRSAHEDRVDVLPDGGGRADGDLAAARRTLRRAVLGRRSVVDHDCLALSELWRRSAGAR